jgi:hypothetical protein
LDCSALGTKKAHAPHHVAIPAKLMARAGSLPLLVIPSFFLTFSLSVFFFSFLFFWGGRGGGVSAPRDGETKKTLDLQQMQTYFGRS